MFTLLQSLVELVVELLAVSCGKIKKLLETRFKPIFKPKYDYSFETSEDLILLIVICVQIRNQCDSKTFHTQPDSQAKLHLAQGRIYVANEYHTFAITMLVVGQKPMILHQITLNRVQNLPVFL